MLNEYTHYGWSWIYWISDIIFITKKKFKPIIIDKLLHKEESIIPKKCVFFKSNIANLYLKKIIKKYNINSVIHFAAYKDVEESIKNPKKYYNNNYLITKKFINCCKEYGVNYLFFPHLQQFTEIYQKIKKL